MNAQTLDVNSGNPLVQVRPLSDKVGILVEARVSTEVFVLAPPFLKDLVKQFGAVVVKGFELDLDQFERFSDEFSDAYMNNRGSGSHRQTAEVGHDGTIQNVAYNYGTDRQRTFPLPLHADRAYLKSQPEVMWFLCARPAERGGQTIVCDGVAVVPALSASTRRLFESKRLKYIRHYTEEQWKLLYQTNDLGEVRQFCEQNDLRLQVNKDRSVQTEFLAPAIRETKWSGSRSFCNSLQIGIWQEKLLGRRVNFVRLEDDSEIPEEVLAEIDEITESLSENIPWSSGDFAIVDNTRMLHGRRAFDDPTREIYVRMCRSVSW